MEHSIPGEEDRSVLEDIERFYQAFDEAERTFPPSVHDPDSDSASDTDLIPDLHIALVPFDLLGVAIDHFHTLRRLSGQPPGGHAEWPARSPWTLLRAALEIASQAIWLVCDDDQDVRVERFLRFHYDDHSQSFVADSLTYAQKDRRKITTPNDFNTEFHRLYQRWDTPASHNRIRTPINFSECVQEAARHVNVVPEDVAEMLWRTASGYAHGRTWAWQATGKNWEVTRDDGRIDTQGGLDYQTVAPMIAVVTVTIQYATWLLNKRAGKLTDYNPVVDIQRPPQQRWQPPTAPAAHPAPPAGVPTGTLSLCWPSAQVSELAGHGLPEQPT